MLSIKTKMYRILFICHGNICRSPMAEFIMKKLVDDKGLRENFYIESCAVSDEEYGNPVYPPVKELLSEKGIDSSSKTARTFRRDDYDNFDYLICMDSSNIRWLNRIIDDPNNKVHLLLEYTNENRDVSDPWYTRDFNKAYDDIYNGCVCLLDYILKES